MMVNYYVSEGENILCLEVIYLVARLLISPTSYSALIVNNRLDICSLVIKFRQLMQGRISFLCLSKK